MPVARAAVMGRDRTTHVTGRFATRDWTERVVNNWRERERACTRTNVCGEGWGRGGEGRGGKLGTCMLRQGQM